MFAKKAFRSSVMLCLAAVIMFCCISTPAYAREKSYYEITEDTCDDLLNIMLLGGGGDNKVFRNGEDFGKVNKENILKAIDRDKINILAGHSTGANQIELFIRDGVLEDDIDMFVIMDGQAFVNGARYCWGDTKHPVLMCMSDQLNRADSFIMKNQYSNYELYYMRNTKHVNLATEHFNDIIEIIHNYFKRHDISSRDDLYKSMKSSQTSAEKVDITFEQIWNDADDQDGKRPDSVTVNLFTGAEKIDSKVITRDKSGKWQCVFEDLPKYEENVEIEYYYEKKNLPTDPNGIPIDYSITENKITGYTHDMSTEGNTISIESTHIPETVDLKGAINWLDRNNLKQTRPESVKLYVMNGTRVVSEAEITAENGWKWAFEGLPKYSGGELVSYTLNEENVDGYSTEYRRASIINTRIT